jgi:triosephosphate isomerase
MRSKVVVGNWKLNGSLAGNETLLKALLGEVDRKPGSARARVCVPAPYLAQVRGLLEGSAIAWGSQDVSRFEQGAYTGEVSGAMLAEMGCRYAIVGHSERRTLFGDTDSIAAHKYVAARKAGLTPIFCVGETLDERDRGITEAVLARQVDALLEMGVAGLSADRRVRAGLGDRHRAHRDLAAGRRGARVHPRARRGEGRSIAASLPILYGGSVKARNAAELFAMPDVDGGLVGGASLVAKNLSAIWRAACAARKGLDAHVILVLHVRGRGGIIALVLLQHGKGADMGAASAAARRAAFSAPRAPPTSFRAPRRSSRPSSSRRASASPGSARPRVGRRHQPIETPADKNSTSSGGACSLGTGAGAPAEKSTQIPK